MKIVRSITIYKPRGEVYRYWRNLENLSNFMQHLVSVRAMNQNGIKSHWVAKAPLGAQVEWDAEISADRPGELISWHSLTGAEIDNMGTVEFKDAPGDRGTEIHVTIVYDAPGGAVGAVVARLLGEEPDKQVHDDLRNLKQILEVGVISAVTGQSSGRRAEVEKERAQLRESQEASR